MPKVDGSAPKAKSRDATAPGKAPAAGKDRGAASRSTKAATTTSSSGSSSKPALPLPRRTTAVPAKSTSTPGIKVKTEPQDFDGPGYTELDSDSEHEDEEFRPANDAEEGSEDESAESSEEEEIVDLGGSLKPKEQETLDYMTRWGGSVYNKHPTVVAIRKAEASHESRPVIVLLEWIELISILQRLALNDDKAPEHVRGKSIPHKVIARFLSHSVDWVSKALQCEAYISMRSDNKNIDDALNRWAQSATGINRLRRRLKAVKKGGKQVEL